MNDLISRSALLEELSIGTIITDDLYGMGIMAGNNHAVKKIKAAPAVDAETVFKAAGLVKEAFEMAKSDLRPVLHGRWVLEREPGGTPYCFHCSVCDDDFCRIEITTAYPYCPN